MKRALLPKWMARKATSPELLVTMKRWWRSSPGWCTWALTTLWGWIDVPWASTRIRRAPPWGGGGDSGKLCHRIQYSCHGVSMKCNIEEWKAIHRNVASSLNLQGTGWVGTGVVTPPPPYFSCPPSTVLGHVCPVRNGGWGCTGMVWHPLTSSVVAAHRMAPFGMVF